MTLLSQCQCHQSLVLALSPSSPSLASCSAHAPIPQHCKIDHSFPSNVSFFSFPSCEAIELITFPLPFFSHFFFPFLFLFLSFFLELSRPGSLAPYFIVGKGLWLQSALFILFILPSGSPEYNLSAPGNFLILLYLPTILHTILLAPRITHHAPRTTPHHTHHQTTHLGSARQSAK